MRVTRPTRIPLGAAVAAGPLRADPRYGETLAREFAVVTCENAMKFGPVHPEPRRWDFRDADAIVRFAERRRLAVRGHTLVWHNQLPAWVARGRWTRTSLARVLARHIRTVAGRYRGRIAAWDVVNEAVEDDGSPRATLWRRMLGPRYPDLAFREAHAADPGAALYYNDYSAEETNPKSDAILRLVEGMLARRVPVHGIGLQAHLALESPPRWPRVRAHLKRIAALGLAVQVTELDVRIRTPVTAAKLRRQADVYRRLADACLEAGNCTALVTWGFTDRHSWVPGFFKGCDAALPFDREYRPKPAWRALARLR
jgi:endo-1,4-beta-xylanase